MACAAGEVLYGKRSRAGPSPGSHDASTVVITAMAVATTTTSGGDCGEGGDVRDGGDGGDCGGGLDSCNGRDGGPAVRAPSLRKTSCAWRGFSLQGGVTSRRGIGVGGEGRVQNVGWRGVRF